MAARKLENWLKSYLEFTEETEPPYSYHTWVGISTIAAVLQRKVWLSWGHQFIYPNFYVVLVGPPGGRKGTAMTIGKAMLDDLGMPFTADCITREALVQDLQEQVQTMNTTAYNEEGKLVPIEYAHASVNIFSEELAVFMSDRQPEMLVTLTDLFDCRSRWSYRTKNKGTNDLVNVWLNILGAITPTLLQTRLSVDAIGAGLTSRMIFVVEQGKRKPVPLPFHTKHELALRRDLLEDLKAISKLHGPMTMDKEAIMWYMSWYTEYQKHPAVDDIRFLGYNERRALHLRKLAIVCCCSRDDTLVIKVEDLIRADALLAAIESKMPRAFYGTGGGDHAGTMAQILEYMKINRTATNRELNKAFQFASLEKGLDEIMASLRTSNQIRTELTTEGLRHYYVPQSDEEVSCFWDDPESQLD